MNFLFYQHTHSRLSNKTSSFYELKLFVHPLYINQCFHFCLKYFLISFISIFNLLISSMVISSSVACSSLSEWIDSSRSCIPTRDVCSSSCYSNLVLICLSNWFLWIYLSRSPIFKSAKRPPIYVSPIIIVSGYLEYTTTFSRKE